VYAGHAVLDAFGILLLQLQEDVRLGYACHGALTIARKLKEDPHVPWTAIS
jgi:hypothetical protein